MKKTISFALCSLLWCLSAYAQRIDGDYKFVSIHKQPQIYGLPPNLSVSDVQFADDNNNNRIDANERCKIIFNINNTGKGSAHQLMAKITNSNAAIAGLSFSPSSEIGDIAPGTTKKVEIPLFGDMNLTSAKAQFTISFEEKMGMSPDNVSMEIETKEFIKPIVKIVDYSFLTDNGNIKLGMPVQLKVLVQNMGQGPAEDVKINFTFPVNVFNNNEFNQTIGNLEAGASKEVVFEFFANKLYTAPTIPIKIKLSEKYGKFAESKDVAANVNSQSAGATISIASNRSNYKEVQIQEASLSAEVDKNIPKIKYDGIFRYALVIGNEDYASHQPGLEKENDVPFAANDSKVFRDYCTATLGVAEKNMFYLSNATYVEMSQKIELVSELLKKIPDSCELIFYYAGHGQPDERTKIPYLIPVDVSPNRLDLSIPISDLYKKMSLTKAKKVTAFLDACFTGGGRESGLLAAAGGRALKIKPNEAALPENLVVFAATSEVQSALPYKDKKHGMFTYFLLKKLQESSGNVSYKDLYKYLKDNVGTESLRINGAAQDPMINVSNNIGDSWQTWNFR